jgi:hypothetical protein
MGVGVVSGPAIRRGHCFLTDNNSTAISRDVARLRLSDNASSQPRRRRPMPGSLAPSHEADRAQDAKYTALDWPDTGRAWGAKGTHKPLCLSQ